MAYHSFYNPLSPIYEIGDIVEFSFDGEYFGSGCAYINVIVGIKYPEFGGYQYILKSDLPQSEKFTAYGYQVRKLDCKNCKWNAECKPIERVKQIMGK